MLSFIRNGGETRRYHTLPVLRHQTVAEHSFHVAMLVSWLASAKPPGVGANLLMAALTHDLAEHIMGDLPAPIKRTMPNFPDGTFREVWGRMEQIQLAAFELDWEQTLSEQENFWLKVADAADGCLYCVREREMGNRALIPCYGTFRTYIRELSGSQFDERVLELIDYIDAEWENANG